MAVDAPLPPIPDELIRRRRSPKLAIGSLVVAGAAVAGIVALTSRSSDSAETSNTVAALTTTEVQQRDMTLYDETTATLEFTTSVTVSAPVAGTVTTVAASGDRIDAGTVVATIDGDPVVALTGDVPGYRDLSTSSSDGVDVYQLERNLVALGYDPDGDITIDETYDKATAAAVKRWEVALGLDDDGKVPQSRVVYVPGSLLVDQVTATVGSGVSSGGSLVSGRQTARRFPVPARASDSSVVSTIAPAGTAVSTGAVLFWNGTTPVVAIVGDASAVPVLERDLSLGVADGADVKLLETMLRAGGHDPDNAMTIDDEFDDATVAAVLRWQVAVGVPYVDASATDATVPAGSFVIVPGGLEVGTAAVADGTPILSDTVVLDLTKAARVVSTTAPLGDDTFAVGATMEVEYPDGTTTTGTVTEVGTTATNASGTPGGTPTVPITIEVASIPDSAASFVEIPVTLRVVSTSVPNAIVVPVSALVALKEGGYAVQVVSGKNADGSDATKFVAVEPGVFDDGFVQVTSDSLEAGQSVVVPS